MWRRWIIRGLFVLPILLCVAGWWWSVWHSGYLAILARVPRPDGGTRIAPSTAWGTGWGLLSWDHTRLHGTYAGWRFQAVPIEMQIVPPGFTSFEHTDSSCSFLGFCYYNIRNGWAMGVDVPYWFLIVVFSAILLLVWRWTRPSKPVGAFPVEVVNPK